VPVGTITRENVFLLLRKTLVAQEGGGSLEQSTTNLLENATKRAISEI
jgi:hypothetical protein